MHLVKGYEQVAVFDPTNPYQRTRELYDGTGYTSYYWNPTEGGTLHGLGIGAFSTWPSWLQIGLVGGLSAAVGYFGMKKYGDSHVKPALKKIGLGGLAGSRRRRR